MRGFDRARENPTHRVAVGTTIAERSDLEVGVKWVSTSSRGGLKSGEHYSRPRLQEEECIKDSLFFYRQ